MEFWPGPTLNSIVIVDVNEEKSLSESRRLVLYSDLQKNQLKAVFKMF